MFVTSIVIGLVTFALRVGHRSASVKVISEIVILLELKFEEGYRMQKLLPRFIVVHEHVRALDLLDRLIKISAYSVLTSAVHVCFLREN